MPDPLKVLARLEPRLAEHQDQAATFWDYYLGNPPQPWVYNPRIKAEFQALLDQAGANYTRLVVDALEERLTIDGWTGPDEQRAVQIWEASGLPKRYGPGNVASLVAGNAYLTVWREAGQVPRIAVEDSRQVIHESAPGDPDTVTAAAKIWDEPGGHRANVYLPDGIYKFAREDKRAQAGEDWEQLPDDEGFVRNPVGLRGTVPVVPMPNRPDLFGDGTSEIADAVPVQDRINKTLFDRTVAAEFQAFRQRYIIGMEIETDPETGQPVDPGLSYRAAIDRMTMINKSPDDIEIGEFEQINLEPFLEAVEQDVITMARITRTPPHYLDTKGQFPSGDAIRGADGGLIAKAKNRQETNGGSYNRAMDMALATVGGGNAKVHWANPETRTMGESADWAMKLAQVATTAPPSVLQELLSMVGFDKDQVDRIVQGGQADQILAGLVNSDNGRASELTAA